MVLRDSVWWCQCQLDHRHPSWNIKITRLGAVSCSLFLGAGLAGITNQLGQ